MAGGMGSRERGRGPSLAERSAQSTKAKSPAGACHCWVIEEGARYPGLLLEWRKQGGHWQGLVAYLRVDRLGDYALVQTWLDGERLRAVQLCPEPERLPPKV